ncbi:hypothetical protein PAXINDRAFT_163784 [Paxillus involutus ATCC 200175]|uniref:ER membrane protein complex subunit 1 n=1 Tax=Paxillus involutus ATCC 200175 TaxID=664439 RepID=A0A0C9TZM9_PAXIN|nr:hypothetical protein PAXINDRAFT_163784 [Paxillus involutus ATCC 200175]
MPGIRSLLAFSFFTLCARALHESEVGIVDWHTKLIGVPLHNSQLTAPIFHHDLVLTATNNNVLAALNATDGTIVWRSMYDAEDPILGFKTHDDSISSLSGPGGSTLRTYDIATGHLLLEKRLHNPQDGRLHEPSGLGIGLVHLGGQDADQVLLTNGDTVSRVDTKTGEVLWKWRSPDQGSLVMYSHIYPDPRASTVYLAGFAKSVRSYTLHVTTLDLTTGEVIASVNVPADVANALTDFLLVGPSGSGSPVTSTSTTNKDSDASADKTARTDETGPCLIWLSPSSPSSPSSLSLFSAPLSPSLEGKVLTIPNASYKRIRDVGLSGNGLFMAFRDNGAGEVMGYGSEAGGAGVRVVWDFGDVAASKVNAESHFVGGINEKGEPRIGRVFWSNARNQAIHQTFEAQLEEGKGSVSTFAFPFETKEHGVVKHVAFSPALSSSSNDSAHKVLLTTSTGSLQLWAHDALQWVREESLASVQVATFVELPPARQEVMCGGSGVCGKSGEEGFWGKVGRQVGDAKNLPQFLFHFVTRFVTGSYASPSSPVSLSSPSSASPAIPRSIPSLSPASTLVRDTFSFRQLLIVSTAHGKTFALDTSTGTIVWSRILGLGWARNVGGRIVPVRMFKVREGGVEGEEGGTIGEVPEDGKEGIILVAQRMADNGLVDTVIFHFDPLTGEDIKIVIPKDSDKDDEDDTPLDKETEYANAHANVKDANGQWVTALEGVDVIAGPLIDVFLLPDGKGTVGLLDEFLQVQLYPDTPATRASLTTLAPNLYLALRAGTQVLGHQLGLNDELSNFHVAYPTWRISLADGEEVLEIIRSAHKGGQIASIGKVKGDRSTLYKYLNPHLSVVVTSSIGRSPRTCGVYVLDTVKGTVLYHASLPAAEGKCDVRAALAENWLVYSYYDDEVGVGVGDAKSHRVISVEMYEGNKADEKIRSSDITSYSNKTTEFSVYEQAFVVPHGITAIAPTTTKFGVSTKDMIVASRKNSIHAIPRRLLDPRRPTRKPTTEEAEEMLMQYDAVLPHDPRLTLSHYYEVADVRQILTAPSLLESTSLVLAIGTDLFLTRIATSGTFDVLSENFNKVQLVLTVVGLAVAIAVAKPMVRRKRLRERWYQ